MAGHFDTVVFGSAAARNGLTAVPVCAGETAYAANGISGTGTLVFMKEDGWIFNAGWITAAIANSDQFRFHVTTDPDWNYFDNVFAVDQTSAVAPFDMRMARMHYGVRKGEQLTVECDNNNNNQAEHIGLNIMKGDKPPYYSSQPPANLPPGVEIVMATSAHTHTANTWTEGALTFTNYNLDRNKSYKIWGACVTGATLYWARFAALEGEYRGHYPGLPGADIAAGTFAPFVWSDDFPTFSGLNGINVQNLSSGADTATVWAIAIQEL